MTAPKGWGYTSAKDSKDYRGGQSLEMTAPKGWGYTMDTQTKSKTHYF